MAHFQPYPDQTSRGFPCYLDLEVRQQKRIQLGDEERLVSLVRASADTIEVESSGARISIPLGRRSPAPAPAEDKLPIMVVDGLRIGAEVTQAYAGKNIYSDSHLRIEGAARIHLSDAAQPLLPPDAWSFPVLGDAWRRDDEQFVMDCWLADVVYGYHLGIDIYAPRGTPVVSCVAGTVLALRRFDRRSQRDDYWGNMIAIVDGRGMIYNYAHCDDFAPDIEIGRAIETGQMLGPCGRSGFESTSIRAHLHFEQLLCTDPEQFNFAFNSSGRILSECVHGHVINPYPYLCELENKR